MPTLADSLAVTEKQAEVEIRKPASLEDLQDFKALSLFELCDKLKPVAQNIQSEQRFNMMQMIINKENALNRAVVTGADLSTVISKEVEVKSDVDIKTVIQVAGRFGLLDSTDQTKLLFQLYATSGNLAITEAISVYRGTGDLGNFIDDLNMIAKKITLGGKAPIVTGLQIVALFLLDSN